MTPDEYNAQLWALSQTALTGGVVIALLLAVVLGMVFVRVLTA